MICPYCYNKGYGRHTCKHWMGQWQHCTRDLGHSGPHVACQSFANKHNITTVVDELTFKFEKICVNGVLKTIVNGVMQMCHLAMTVIYKRFIVQGQKDTRGGI